MPYPDYSDYDDRDNNPYTIKYDWENEREDGGDYFPGGDYLPEFYDWEEE